MEGNPRTSVVQCLFTRMQYETEKPGISGYEADDRRTALMGGNNSAALHTASAAAQG